MKVFLLLFIAGLFVLTSFFTSPLWLFLLLIPCIGLVLNAEVVGQIDSGEGNAEQLQPINDFVFYGVFIGGLYAVMLGAGALLIFAALALSGFWWFVCMAWLSAMLGLHISMSDANPQESRKARWNWHWFEDNI